MTPPDLRPAQRSAFEADALAVAPLLLGAVLGHTTAEGRVAVRLTEVEAYRGDDDPGSHAFRGRTPRTAAMFGEPGLLYAYFTYGMHTCLNVVCSPEGTASAVLLRAGEIVDGAGLAAGRRTAGRPVVPRDLARGPARLAVALGVPLAANGDDLLVPPFDLAMPTTAGPAVVGPRVGVAAPGGTDAFPWRFSIPGDPTVSAYRPHRSVG